MQKTFVSTIAVTFLGLLLLSGCQKEKITISGELNGYSYVDLGLPSGTLWATCNVGANDSEDEGNCYAWGETRTKGYYDWSNYKYGQEGEWSLYGFWHEGHVNKYCDNSVFGIDGFTDYLTRLLASDDVATVVWGEGWRMPTKNEWDELMTECSWKETKYRGTYGILFTSDNGNSIFMPSSSCRVWYSSSLYTEPICAFGVEYIIDEHGGHLVMAQVDRAYGAYVRPVCVSRKN